MGRSKDIATSAKGDADYVNVSGDTVTGALTVDTSTTTNLTVDSGNYGGIQFKAAGTDTGYITSYTNGSGAEAMYIGGADTVNLHTGTNHGLTNGTTRLGIDVSGRVTMPNQPSFAAAVSANNWTTSSAADCPFDTELFDIGGHYNTSNYTFTAPVAGRYFTSFFLNRYSDSRFDIAFMVNGAARHGLEVREAGAGQWHMESAQVILSLSANDAVKMRITSVTTTGTAIFDGGGTYYDVFCMHLLG